MRISDWSSDVCSSDLFDLTRPGLSIYSGVQVPEMEGHIRQVARPEVELLQVREISAGDSVGYNATFTAERPMRVGVLNLGYADGSNRKSVVWGKSVAVSGETGGGRRSKKQKNR